MLRGWTALCVIAAVTLSGCTGGVGGAIGLNKASLDEPSFDLSPERGEKDTLFQVDSRGLGDRYNVTWDWGDGTLSYGGTAEHKYGFTNGVMTVTLIVTADDGEQGFARRDITLGSGVNKPPTVTVSSSKTWIEVGQRINVSANGNDGDRDPLTYSWSHRAQGAAAETQVEGSGKRTPFSFDAPGVYTVFVRAHDPKGGEAVASLNLTVSKDIPATRFEATFNGTIVAGSGGAGVSEKAWAAGAAGAPDTAVDSVRHRYTLDYPGSTLLFLTWNDTSGQGAIDLDLELRHASNGTVIFTSAYRGPPNAPFEFNMTQQEPGDYDVIVRGVVAANIAYAVLVQSTLQITPALVLAKEGA